MTQYCNIDIKKYKTKSDVNEKAEYNLRITSSANIDKTKSSQNLIVKPIIKTDMYDYIEDYIKKNVTEPYRKDAVKTVNLVFSASNEFFGSEKDIQKFQSAVNKYLQQQGLTHVIYSSMHLDETTPHMHVCVVPIVTNGSKTSLNASKWFDGPSKVKEFTKGFGKLIGLPTAKPTAPGAKATRKDLSEHYKQVNQAVATDKKLDQALIRYETEIENSSSLLNPWDRAKQYKALAEKSIKIAKKYSHRLIEVVKSNIVKQEMVNLEQTLYNCGFKPNIINDIKKNGPQVVKHLTDKIKKQRQQEWEEQTTLKNKLIADEVAKNAIQNAKKQAEIVPEVKPTEVSKTSSKFRI